MAQILIKADTVVIIVSAWHRIQNLSSAWEPKKHKFQTFSFNFDKKWK